MAFGLTREELIEWKNKVISSEIAIITHYWQDDRFPNITTVTKIGCADLNKLTDWGLKYNLKPEWIDLRIDYPHFDVFGKKQVEILLHENQTTQIERFQIKIHY